MVNTRITSPPDPRMVGYTLHSMKSYTVENGKVILTSSLCVLPLKDDTLAM